MKKEEEEEEDIMHIFLKLCNNQHSNLQKLLFSLLHSTKPFLDLKVRLDWRKATRSNKNLTSWTARERLLPVAIFASSCATSHPYRLQCDNLLNH